MKITKVEIQLPIIINEDHKSAILLLGSHPTLLIILELTIYIYQLDNIILLDKNLKEKNNLFTTQIFKKKWL